jgi:hypothetical protein
MQLVDDARTRASDMEAISLQDIKRSIELQPSDGEIYTYLSKMERDRASTLHVFAVRKYMQLLLRGGTARGGPIDPLCDFEMASTIIEPKEVVGAPRC